MHRIPHRNVVDRILNILLCARAGGGVTQIVMPYMTEGIAKHVPEFEAWRWAFFLPGGLFIIITFLILILGQVSSFIFVATSTGKFPFLCIIQEALRCSMSPLLWMDMFPFARHAAPKEGCSVDGFVASICIWTVISSCHTQKDLPAVCAHTHPVYRCGYINMNILSNTRFSCQEARCVLQTSGTYESDYRGI